MTTTIRLSRSGILSALLASVLFLPAQIMPAETAELVMMEQDGCVWCKRWHREIGSIYHGTSEGRRAPLRIVNIHGEWPEDLKNVPLARFTPTFVLVEDGEEIARLRGYRGPEYFWGDLGKMLDMLSPED